MYKKYLNYVLPIFGAVVIVGSGFSSWIFNEVANKSKDITGTINVNPMESLSAELTTDITAFTLHLDQGGVGNTNVNEGIYFNNDTSKTSLEVTLTYTLSSATDFSAWDSVTCYYSVTYTLTDAVKEYITIADVAEAEMTTVNTTDPKSHVYTQKFTMAFSYVEGKKPTNATEYEAMKTACENAAITVTVNTKTVIE